MRTWGIHSGLFKQGSPLVVMGERDVWLHSVIVMHYRRQAE